MQHSIDLVELDLLQLNSVDEFCQAVRQLYQEAALDAFDLGLPAAAVYWRADCRSIEFSDTPIEDGDLLGFAPSPLAALEVTARADVWPKVRHALLEATLSQDPPFDPLPRPDAICAQLLGELVARVNLVQTVPDPAPDIVAWNCWKRAEGRPTTPRGPPPLSSRLWTYLPPSFSRASSLPPAWIRRQAAASRLPPYPSPCPPRLDLCRGMADPLPPPGSPAASN